MGSLFIRLAMTAANCKTINRFTVIDAKLRHRQAPLNSGRYKFAATTIIITEQVHVAALQQSRKVHLAQLTIC